MRLSMLLLLLPISACASSSGVYAVGGDTFKVTTTAMTSMGGQGTAKGSAIHQATDYCARTGRAPEVVQEAGNAQFTQGTTEVTFKCVGTGKAQP